MDEYKVVSLANRCKQLVLTLCWLLSCVCEESCYTLLALVVTRDTTIFATLSLNLCNAISSSAVNWGLSAIKTFHQGLLKLFMLCWSVFYLSAGWAVLNFKPFIRGFRMPATVARFRPCLPSFCAASAVRFSWVRFLWVRDLFAISIAELDSRVRLIHDSQFVTTIDCRKSRSLVATPIVVALTTNGFLVQQNPLPLFCR